MYRRNKGIVYILFIVIVLLLCSCSNGNDAKSESEILKDISTQDHYFSNYEIEISSSNITKRQTNEDSKTDYVWISIVGEAEDFTYFADYELTYVLYNDGWLLENFDEVNSSYEAKLKPDIKAIESTIPVTYTDCSLISEQQSSANSYSYLYSGYSEISDVLLAQYDLTVTAYFNPNSGWTTSLSEKEGALNWNLNGNWEYNNGDINISAVVSDFIEDPNGEEHILQIEYTCKTDNGIISSNGVIEYYLQNDFHYNSIDYYLENKYVDWSNDPKVYINIAATPVKMVNYGGATGNGLFFKVWDGRDWYYQFLTKTTEN